MTRCRVALGSNLGDRAAHLRFGFRGLDRLPGTRLLRRSAIRASAPMGAHAGGEYLNAVAEVETRLSPIGLLVECKRLEALRGRRPDGRWRPRPLDLDLLSYGSRSVKTRILRVPHPGAHRRTFVKAALADLGELIQ